MFTDFILNGSAHGNFAEQMQNMRFDTGLLRPFRDERGRKMVTVNTGQMKYDKKLARMIPIYETVSVKDLEYKHGINIPTANATSLRKEEWLLMDRQIIRAARSRLRAWSDLSKANTFGGFNGMSKLVLEHETMSDPGEAIVDMNGISEGRTDAPEYQLQGLPLPITHVDFYYDARRLAASRNGGTPIDLTMGEAGGRRIAEMVERTLIGTVTGMTYGGGSSTPTYGRASTVFGYTNFTNRLTKTNLTTPTGSNPEVTVANVLTMRDQLFANNFFGPFMLYHSNDWDQYMDNDYARLGGNNASMTLRDRLRAIDDISDVRRLDFLPSSTNPFTLIMVQMTADVVRAVNGMDITTVQWETRGGMQQNFKIMAIWVPQIRADHTGQCGLLHATTS